MRSRLFLVALALALAVGLFAVVWLESRSVATERVGPTETPQSDARDAQPELAHPLADPAIGPRREAFEPADSALDRTYLPTEVAL
ncbi:MAG: hypothetical protein IT453_05645, partial [Planctomycetes bacterium]|nr:hypothetical protein [Planctomycetota bacterium]